MPQHSITCWLLNYIYHLYFHTRGPYISLCLFLGWLFDIGAGVRERVTTWWIGVLVGYWLVGSVLFNVGALYRRKRARVVMVLSSFLRYMILGFAFFYLLCLSICNTLFISSTSFLDATKKRKKGPKGVQSLVKRWGNELNEGTVSLTKESMHLTYFICR